MRILTVLILFAAASCAVFFYFLGVRNDKSFIAQEKSKIRVEAKQYESYLKSLYAQKRAGESRKLLENAPVKNPALVKFFEVLDTDPQSLAVLSDNSEASAHAARFYALKEKAYSKALAPVEARMKKRPYLLTLQLLGVLIIAAWLFKSSS